MKNVTIYPFLYMILVKKTPVKKSELDPYTLQLMRIDLHPEVFWKRDSNRLAVKWVLIVSKAPYSA